MSGGVDSSVAAALMAEQGYEVVGVTLKLLPNAETGFGCCGSPADIDDARRVCEALGAPHYVLSLSQLFEDRVIRPFVESYLRARTPNPCAECNRWLKFGSLLALAKAWGAQGLATGHYARVKDGRLLRARDREKDQTYFLYSLTARELAFASFPIGELSKAEVRGRARELGLKTADKPESQELCFVPRRDYVSFIHSRLGTASSKAVGPGETPALDPGPIRDVRGRFLGVHQGLVSYTIGQRKGLGLSSPEPLYVVAIEPESRALVVGPQAEAFSPGFTAEGVSWTAEALRDAFEAQVRIRHRHPPAPAVLTPLSGGRVAVRFEEPQRAAAPGQAAVFYAGEEVLGGGTIASLLSEGS